MKLHHWLKKLIVVIVTVLSIAEGPVSLLSQATTCNAPDFRRYCACVRCNYYVVCGGTASANPSLTILVCTGTNPGIMGSECKLQESGYDSCYPGLVRTCGTAVAVLPCCGGSRATFSDWSLYQTRSPGGQPCASGGTTL